MHQHVGQKNSLVVQDYIVKLVFHMTSEGVSDGKMLQVVPMEKRHDSKVPDEDTERGSTCSA